MPPHISRQLLADPSACRVLHAGRYGNATVWSVCVGDERWVVKDFAKCPWILRWSFGLWMAGHEFRVLKRLQTLDGAPREVFRLDSLAFGYRYIEGRPLREIPRGECPRSYFENLEALIARMHQYAIVHLDLRNGRNHIVDAQWQPYLIDFQSAISTRWLPPAWRRRLERIDLSGVYKYWLLHDAEGLEEGRRQTLLWQMRNRRWWRLRGYRMPGTIRKLNADEQQFLERERGMANAKKAERRAGKRDKN